LEQAIHQRAATDHLPGGASRWTILKEVITPEPHAGVIMGFIVTVVTLMGASAMARVAGSGATGILRSVAAINGVESMS
jgi:ABC-type methionine transport system permease subunit